MKININILKNDLKDSCKLKNFKGVHRYNSFILDSEYCLDNINKLNVQELGGACCAIDIIDVIFSPIH